MPIATSKTIVATSPSHTGAIMSVNAVEGVIQVATAVMMQAMPIIGPQAEKNLIALYPNLSCSETPSQSIPFKVNQDVASAPAISRIKGAMIAKVVIPSAMIVSSFLFKWCHSHTN